MRREELEQIMNDTDSMDGREIAFSMDFYRRNKVSNHQRQTESGTIQYPNLTELITNETRYDFGRGSRDIMPYTKHMTTMLHDTHFVVLNTWYDHSRSNQRLPFQVNDRLTVGLGLFYHRTNYTIEEDESYYYVTCDFDLYRDDRIMEGHHGIENGPDYALIPPRAGRNTPMYPERDQTLHDLHGSFASGDGRRPQAPHFSLHVQHIDTIYDLLKTRQPYVKDRAMSRRYRTLIPSAAKSCIAISKTMEFCSAVELQRQEAIKTTHLRANELVSPQQITWLTPSMTTLYIRNNAVHDEHGCLGDANVPELLDLDTVDGFRTNQKQSYYGNSTHWKKKDNLFLGIKGNSDKFIFARLISTKLNPGDLVSLMKSKMQVRNYPETNNINLLSDNAIVDNYDYDSLEDAPSEMFRGLRLVRVGDCTTTGGGQVLLDYCTNIDGVYTLNIQRNIMLRQGMTKMILYGGQYRVCIPKDTYDIIQYTSQVSTTLEDITVEEIRDRLSFGSTPTEVVVQNKVRSRQISFGNSEVETTTMLSGLSRLQLNSLNEEE